MDDDTVPEEHPAVTSRKEAISSGQIHFFDGKPCRKGHFSPRYVSNKVCLACRKASSQKSADTGLRCSVEGCDKKHMAKGYCGSHYERWKLHGDPLAGRTYDGESMKWLLEHVSYREPECLIWPFWRTPRGYPGISRHNGKSGRAHVVMCGLAHGDKPSLRHICAHSCGKGHEGCINPTHLRWATHAENSADTLMHGTRAKGEKLGISKLKEDDVRKIRELIGTMSMGKIADKFGVTKSNISYIKRGKSWSWLI